jgi:hypothetical protein
VRRAREQEDYTTEKTDAKDAVLESALEWIVQLPERSSGG